MLYTDFLKELRGCPFCDPSQRVLIENDFAYLTYALAPYHKHHLLVIPKRHLSSFFDLKSREIENISILLRSGMKILQRLNYNNSSILVRNGDNSQKSVEHLHYHIIPEIRIGDIDHKGDPRKVMTNEEIKDLMSELRSLLPE